MCVCVYVYAYIYIYMCVCVCVCVCVCGALARVFLRACLENGFYSIELRNGTYKSAGAEETSENVA